LASVDTHCETAKRVGSIRKVADPVSRDSSFLPKAKRDSTLWFLRFVVFAAIALPGTKALPVDAADASSGEREAAVTLARGGDAQGGLLLLRSLLLQHPEDPRLLADTTIVAGWAGQDSLVLELYARTQTPKDECDVTEAAAHAARDLKQYDFSLQLYRQSADLDPNRWQPRLGEAMVLAEKSDFNEATALMEPLLRDHGGEREVVSGQAYVCNRQGDYACAIAMYQLRLAQSADDLETRCQLAQALSMLGGATYALQLCTHPHADMDERLNAAAAAEQVRWGEGYAPTRKQHEAESEQSLARLDRVIAASAPADPVWQQAQYDRLLALSDLRRSRDTTRAYESLRTQQFTVPFYARQRVADAYLALRQPEKAALLYHQILEHAPGDGAAWSGLAYAQLESEHLKEGFRSIDYAYADAPAWLQAPGLKVPQPNLLRTALGLQAAEMRGSADLLAEEQKRVARMVALAPANADLRRQLAMTYLARGWPLLAIKEARLSDSYAESEEIPSLDSLEINETAGRRDIADAMLPNVFLHEGNSPGLSHFLRDRASERGWQLDLNSVFEWSSGTFLGSTDQHNEAHLYSPLIDNRWSWFVHELRDTGSFSAGDAARTRGGLGAAYNYNRQLVWAEIAGDTGTYGTRAAANGGARLSLGDRWTLRAEGDSDSIADVQLISVLANVHARSLDLNLGWRGSELEEGNIGLQRVLFSDGNQRAAIPAVWEQRVWTSPHLQVKVSGEEWTSSNSRDEDRLYFNPKHDFSLGPRATFDWLTWRRYDRSFRQEFSAYTAPYWQQNHGTGGAFAVSYSQHWKLGQSLGLLWGVTWNTQPYDGVNESYTALNAGLTWGHR
jgi:biofilm PGA synthesis protein PgaA